MSVYKINPKKLLRSKWTAVTARDKEKHFIVTALISPDLPSSIISLVELEAIYTKRKQIIAWRVLMDPVFWLQGWV